MLLKDLVDNISVLEVNGNYDGEIKGIVCDSRKVKKGYIFVAISGYKDSGVKYVAEAINRGARVIVSEKGIDSSNDFVSVRVEDARKALADLARIFYSNPSANLRIIGITGTNGKTTISYFAESILKNNNSSVAVLGTIAYKIGEKVLSAPTTTPQSSDLQMIMNQMLEKNIDTLVMEVSSHALRLERVRGCEFDVALFTNLTPEHMDFHINMEDYFAAKSKLFYELTRQTHKKNPIAIVNIDDEYADRIINTIHSSGASPRIITYGIEKPCDVKANNIKMNSKNSSFVVNYPNGKVGLNINLIGKYNVYNAIAAFSIGYALGIKEEIIIKGIEALDKVPGRFEKIYCGQPFSVIVDYAHTSDALLRLLLAVKQTEPKRLITVFGCGGDRDREKRPVMGEIASRHSDYVIVTSDNPRSEDPQRIALDIEVGIKRIGKENYKIIVDRRDAIEQAIRMAEKGDIVVIAGKGHESCQILSDETIPFDDREVAKEVLDEIKCNKNNKSSQKSPC